MRNGWALARGGVLIASVSIACAADPAPPIEPLERPAPLGTAGAPGDDYERQREQMVARQIEARGIEDRRVLHAMRAVPRHEFVPEPMRRSAYRDTPLPIGKGQTISQPYIVAYMTELLQLSPDDKVLEIGTGSGYQAAVLAELAGEVYSIEIVPELAAEAKRVLEAQGYENLHLRLGDGYKGWPEAAPFDAIIVTAAPDHIPQPLIDQLAVGGRMVVPVGTDRQEMMVITKTKDGVEKRTTIPVRFVPLVRERG